VLAYALYWRDTAYRATAQTRACVSLTERAAAKMHDILDYEDIYHRPAVERAAER
jgi:hypothetical protein